MRYRVEILPSALRALQRLERPMKRRISVAIDELAAEPRPAGAVKMQGALTAWRIRVGDYRVVYTIDDKIVTVCVVAIGHRREVYRRGGFTWVVLLVVIATVGLILLLVVVSCESPRRVSSYLQNSCQARMVHSGLALYAQDNGGYYPGLNKTGLLLYADVESRYLALLNSHYLAGQSIISPSEIKTEWTSGMVLTPDNYSYAMLAIAAPGGRQSEWRQTSNAQAAVVSDRNAGTN